MIITIIIRGMVRGMGMVMAIPIMIMSTAKGAAAAMITGTIMAINTSMAITMLRMTTSMTTSTATIITTERTAAGITTITSMADAAELQRLAWFSPAFPVGGFAYSHGIEKAVETGDVTDAASLASWISAILRHGAGWNDAVLIGEAWLRTAETDRTIRERSLVELAELGAALSLSRERRLETVQQGTAFFRLIQSAWPHPDLPDFTDADLPYPVAVGIAGRLHSQPLSPLVAAYLQAFAGNLIAAGIRLSVIGQQGAQAKLAGLLPLVADLADRAAAARLDDLGGMAFRADLMSLRHETQQVRLFRS